MALESMGYSNYYEDLNSDDYGVPQTRNRCFMVSILGQYSYIFPNKIPLEYRLKDLLVAKAPEKYYLTEKQMQNITLWNNTTNRMERGEKDSAGTLTTHAGRNDYDCNYVPIKENTKRGYKEASEGDGVYTNGISKKRGTVQDGKIQTIKTSLDVGVVAKDEKGSAD